MTTAVTTREIDYRMPYSVGIRVPAWSDLLFIAGATSLPLYHRHPHVSSELQFPSEAGMQAKAALESIQEVVEGAGGSLADVVRLDVFITDMKYQEDIGDQLGTFFPGEKPPAMTLIAVRELVVPGLVVEINAIAALDHKARK